MRQFLTLTSEDTPYTLKLYRNDFLYFITPEGVTVGTYYFKTLRLSYKLWSIDSAEYGGMDIDLLSVIEFMNKRYEKYYQSKGE